VTKGDIKMTVKAIEFVMNYETYIKEIEAVVRPEFKPKGGQVFCFDISAAS